MKTPPLGFFRPPQSLFLHAAAMSFLSALNLIPILYIGFFLFSKTPSFQAFAHKVQLFLLNVILPTNSLGDSAALEGFLQGAANLDAAGFIAILLALLSSFITYEKIISHACKLPARPTLVALALYWALTTLAPLGLGASFYASFLLQDAVGLNLPSLLPIMIVFLLFFAAFIFSLNAPLKIGATAAAAALSALLWTALKWLFLLYFKSSPQLSIYGGFSVVFAVLLWLYLSWALFFYAAALLANYHRFMGFFAPAPAAAQAAPAPAPAAAKKPAKKPAAKKPAAKKPAAKSPASETAEPTPSENLKK